MYLCNRIDVYTTICIYDNMAIQQYVYKYI